MLKKGVIMDVICECKSITKIYKTLSNNVTALDDVSLSIEEGEFVVLAGPSGSGKTTLANILGCLDTPDSGYFSFRGLELSQATIQQRTETRKTSIGFVFQNFNLIPVLTAGENVALACELQGIDRGSAYKQAQQALLDVGLDTMDKRLPSELSGGQQQRVAIARAIVKKPSLLIADEPTANLDSTTTHEIVALLQNLNKLHGITCVICSHDHRVIDVAQRELYISDGKIYSDKRN